MKLHAYVDWTCRQQRQHTTNIIIRHCRNNTRLTNTSEMQWGQHSEHWKVILFDNNNKPERGAITKPMSFLLQETTTWECHSYAQITSVSSPYCILRSMTPLFRRLASIHDSVNRAIYLVLTRAIPITTRRPGDKNQNMCDVIHILPCRLESECNGKNDPTAVLAVNKRSLITDEARCRLAVCFTPRPLYPRGKDWWQAGWPQSPCSRCRGEINPALFLLLTTLSYQAALPTTLRSKQYHYSRADDFQNADTRSHLLTVPKSGVTVTSVD